MWLDGLGTRALFSITNENLLNVGGAVRAWLHVYLRHKRKQWRRWCTFCSVSGFLSRRTREKSEKAEDKTRLKCTGEFGEDMQHYEDGRR